jgi:hypothetical protein
VEAHDIAEPLSIDLITESSAEFRPSCCKVGLAETSKILSHGVSVRGLSSVCSHPNFKIANKEKVLTAKIRAITPRTERRALRLVKKLIALNASPTHREFHQVGFVAVKEIISQSQQLISRP